MMICKFLDAQGILKLHQQVLHRFGGLAGVRDFGLLESATMYPQQIFAYGENDFFVLAATYCFGIIKNHSFMDGNKRTGLLAAITFLDANNIDIECNFEALYQLAIGVAESSVHLDEIACFLRNSAAPK